MFRCGKFHTIEKINIHFTMSSPFTEALYKVNKHSQTLLWKIYYCYYPYIKFESVDYHDWGQILIGFACGILHFQCGLNQVLIKWLLHKRFLSYPIFVPLHIFFEEKFELKASKVFEINDSR